MIIILLSTDITTLENLLNVLPLHSKLNLKEFKDKLVLFYHDTIKIRPNNENQIKDLENTKVVLYIALKLRNNLLHMYKNQDDKFKKTKKKRRKVQNVSENFAINLYLDEDDLPPMSALEGVKEVKLEPGETIVDRLKLISQKGKASGTGLKFLTPKKLLTKIISTNKKWKQFIQFQKWKQKNDISFLSTQ